jgi:eukaryotic-like serine/threonine-protein kinase
MRPTKDNTDFPLDDVSPVEMQRLVAYEKAKSAESRLSPEVMIAAAPHEPLASDQACVDLLHRVWPDWDRPAPTASENSPPKVLGDFRMVREIGRGGMGVVYEAEQISLGRHVALKVLPFASLFSETLLTRFKNEIRTAASLDHPHIASVLASGEERGVHFYAMRFIRGRNLAEIIEEIRAREQVPSHDKRSVDGDTLAPGPEANNSDILSSVRSRDRGSYYRRVAELGIQACEALQYAHEMGVVHRDIKPSNLLINADGWLWVSDFGLALSREDTGLTLTGDLVGTLRYMSPEQARGDRNVLDQRTDIYSLGATLYELLTLRPAVNGNGRHQVLTQLTDEKPTAPRRHDLGISRDLETILLKTLEKDPAHRYQTMQQLGEDLRRFCQGKPIVARQVPRAERIAHWIRRNPLVSALLFSILTLSLTVAAVATVGYLRTQHALEEKVAATIRLRAEQEASYRNLYAAEIRNAHQLWKSGRCDSMNSLLAHHLPIPNRTDLRGWEWYYLLALSHGELARVVDPGNCFLSIAWSPDGRRIAASGYLGLFVADSATGQKLWSDRVRCRSLSWSPDGQRLATASSTVAFAVSIRDADTGRRMMEFEGHRNPVTSVAWSPDGKQLAAGSFDGSCRIWEATTGKQRFVLGKPDRSGSWFMEPAQRREATDDWDGDGTTRRATFIAWSSDSKRLVSASSNHAIRVWSVETGHELQAMQTGGYLLMGMALSPNGRHLAIAGCEEAGGGTVMVFDATSGQLKQSLPQSAEVLCLAFSPDDRSLAVGSRGLGGMRILDVETGQVVRIVRGFEFTPFAVAYSPDGSRLATGCTDGALRIWDAARSQDAVEWNSNRWTGPVIWSPDGQHLACGVTEGKIAICEVSSGKTIQSIAGDIHGLRQPAWSSDGKLLAWATEGPGTFSLINVETGKRRFTFDHGAPIRALEFNPNGRQLASASKDIPVVKIWDPRNGQQIQTLATNGRGVLALAWSPDGTRIATAGINAAIQIWSASEWEPIAQVDNAGHRWLGSLAWSPDGRRLAAAGWDGLVRVWDVQEGRLHEGKVAHGAPVATLIWLAGSNRLASASGDGTVKIWDADSLDELLTLETGPGLVSAADHPNGWKLATVSENGLHLWDAEPGFNLDRSDEYSRQRAQRYYCEGLLYGNSADLVCEARRLDPTAYGGWCRAMGQLALDRGEHETAVMRFTEALAESATDEMAVIYDLRGRALIGLKRFDAAAIDFTQAMNRAETSAAEYRLHRAIAYRHGCHFGKAIADSTLVIDASDEPGIRALACRERALCNLCEMHILRALIDYVQGIGAIHDLAAFATETFIVTPSTPGDPK